jgi:NACalpha-BTF3-like transcription factor
VDELQVPEGQNPQDYPKSDDSEESKESKKKIPNELYKTKLCDYHEKGECKNGASCQYAHGKEELRVSGFVKLKKEKPMKKEICKYFAEKKPCPHKVCNFICYVDQPQKVESLVQVNKVSMAQLKSKLSGPIQKMHAASQELLSLLASLTEEEQAAVSVNSIQSFAVEASGKSNEILTKISSLGISGIQQDKPVQQNPAALPKPQAAQQQVSAGANELGVNPESVVSVMRVVKCTKDQAIMALFETDGDVVKAIKILAP